MGRPGWDGVAGVGQDDCAAGAEGQPVSLMLALWDAVTELPQGQEQWPAGESRELGLLPGAVLQACMAGARRSLETEGWKEVQTFVIPSWRWSHGLTSTFLTDDSRQDMYTSS